MPIQTSPVQTLNLVSIRRAIQQISRSSFNLQNPSEDSLYVTSAPTKGDLAEGQGVFFFDGSNYKLYVKIAGEVKSVSFT